MHSEDIAFGISILMELSRMWYCFCHMTLWTPFVNFILFDIDYGDIYFDVYSVHTCVLYQVSKFYFVFSHAIYLCDPQEIVLKICNMDMSHIPIFAIYQYFKFLSFLCYTPIVRC